jgi:hypothetical protein
VATTLVSLAPSPLAPVVSPGGRPKVVSDRIGHANVGFFLQTYAHVLGNDDREAAEQAASFLIEDGWGPDEKEADQSDETI